MSSDSIWYRILWWITEQGRYSVTRINQLVSLFVTLVWVGLLIHVLPLHGTVNWFYTAIVALSALFCLAFVAFGKSGRGRPPVYFTIREKKTSTSADAGKPTI
jgi:hypothetical protein